MIKKYKDIIILAICLLTLLQVYLCTTFPAFKNDDSPETITAAYTLGIAHPPTYPLFTMAGKVFSLLPIGSPAFRLNTFSIFLAMLVLLASFILIKQNMRIFFGGKYREMGFFAVFLLAFSYIFWNQSIEAKGGIYILNLLFLAILICLSLELFKNFNTKYLYMMSFIYGLSLANHWPSMIILLPLVAYVFIIHWRKISAFNTATLLALLILGTSPYLYLAVRSRADGILVSTLNAYIFRPGMDKIMNFVLKPDTWGNFWWTILRLGYKSEPIASAHLYAYQMKEFFMLTAGNYYLLWILLFAGGYIIFKRNKRIFYYYLAAVLITAFMVVIFNRSKENLMWITDVFLMPVQYIFILFIAAGAGLCMEFLKKKPARNIFIAAIICLLIFVAAKNFTRNNSRYDFHLYDYGKNAMKTMDEGSLYLCDRDYNIFTMYYLQKVEKERLDIKPVFVADIPYGEISNFIDEYGKDLLQGYNPAENLANMINYYYENKVQIYKSTFSPVLNILKLSGGFKQNGLLKEYLPDNSLKSYSIFRVYSYNHGLYDKYTDFSANLGIITWYPFCMVLQGNDFLSEQKPNEALQFYNKALLFPIEGIMKDNEPQFFYNLYLANKYLNNEDNQVIWLKKAIEAKQGYWQAYEELGMLYLKEQNLPMALEMFENAILYGDNNANMLNEYIDKIKGVDINSQYEAIFNKATQLLDGGNFDRAMDIYAFLIKKEYKEQDIYKNIGVHFYQKNDYRDALEYFLKSKNIQKDIEIYYDVAETYYKTGQKDKAMAIIEEGITAFGNNNKLEDLKNLVK